MGLDEPGPRGYDDVGELLERNPHLRTRVAYHVESDALPVARVNGITTVAVVQAGGIFGGEVPVMNLDGWTWEEATVRPNAGIQFTFPALGTGRAGAVALALADAVSAADERDLRRHPPRARSQARRVVRLFEDVRAYARAGSERTR